MSAARERPSQEDVLFPGPGEQVVEPAALPRAEVTAAVSTAANSVMATPAATVAVNVGRRMAFVGEEISQTCLRRRCGPTSVRVVLRADGSDPVTSAMWMDGASSEAHHGLDQVEEVELGEDEAGPPADLLWTGR